MNVFTYFNQKIHTIFLESFQGLNFEDVKNATTQSPREKSMGDLASNIAMVAASKLKMKPIDVANILLPKIREIEEVAKVEVAGAGFINIFLGKSFWVNQLKLIDIDAEAYLHNKISSDKINVEYVSANPTGPMHIGHTRNAIYGDALSNILKYTGFDVTKEYYVNDAGRQIDVLAESLEFRYKQIAGMIDRNADLPEGSYPGDYLIEIANKIHLASKLEPFSLNEDERKDFFKKQAIKECMDLIKSDLAGLAVVHDKFIYESELHKANEIEKTIEFLSGKGLVYRGILEPPKGKKPDDWEPREQLLFRATNFGDDIDRPLQKSDGSWTYFAADIAYMKHKIDRGFNKLVFVLGADHGGYKKRLEAVCEALSGGACEVDVKICQLVRLLKNGEPYKMSKRKGNFVTAEEVTKLVGKDNVRFMMLTHKNDIGIDFDVDKVVDQSKDNPVFYVQYAHARGKSVIRNAKEICHSAYEKHTKHMVNYSLIDSQAEIELIKTLSQFPQQIYLAAIHHEPDRIIQFLINAASEFHALWNRGKYENIKFIDVNDVELTAARLTLVNATCKIIKKALDLIGVEAVEKM